MKPYFFGVVIGVIASMIFFGPDYLFNRKAPADCAPATVEGDK